MHETDAVGRARRAMEICNACRYCEGYCAVFPAMELHRSFSAADLGYLANLCHNCRDCYYACQYAPPHEFGVNLPKTFSELRVETYEHYAWPGPFAVLFRRNAFAVSLATACAVALVPILTALMEPGAVLFAAHRGPGAFYAIIPWGMMAGIAGLSFCFAIVALFAGAARFWRDAGANRARMSWRAVRRALGDAATLRNLGGGGHGCNDRDGSFSQGRRHFHHALFYGFALCFASTSIATIDHHVLGLEAPYSWLSLPVMLGTLGGVGMVIGSAGLIAIKLTSDAAPVAPRVAGADYALLMLLLLVALTGLTLRVGRDTSLMGLLLAIHLGLVLSLFVMTPYTKMVHGVYRAAALLRAAAERP